VKSFRFNCEGIRYGYDTIIKNKTRKEALGEKISDTKRNIMERITDYFSFFLEAIKDNAWVRNEEVSFREIGEKEGYIER